MRYRTKPSVVEAEQFDPGVQPWPEGVEALAAPLQDGDATFTHLLDAHPHTWFLRVGAYIVTDPQGRRRVEAQRSFERDYEPMEKE